MTILYTRAVVEQAAKHLGDASLVGLYFDGNMGAFEKINGVLKDATFKQPEGRV